MNQKGNAVTVSGKTVVKPTPTILFNDESLISTCVLQKGTTFAEISSVTDPRMNKTGNRFLGLVSKHGRMNVMFGDNYEAGVQRKADKEGLDTVFVAQPLKWGKHYRDSAFVIEHKGNFYLQCRVLASHEVEYRWIQSGTLLNEAEVLEMKSFFPKKSEGSRQPAQDKVIYRTLKVCNITKIQMFGIRFLRLK